MSDNWVKSEMLNADQSRGFLLIENPKSKTYLDNLLLSTYWPKIRLKLEETNYNYNPKKKPETEFILFPTQKRSFTFMLLYGTKLFFRGKLNCSLESWMLESEFFLGLQKENNHDVIFEILGNSRFYGNPPELRIDKRDDEYFQITFTAGFGESWGINSDKDILCNIDELIEVNTELYEYSADGIITEELLGDFLTLANKIYESG